MKALTNNVKWFKRTFFTFIHSVHYRNILTEIIISNYYMVLILRLFGVYSVFYSNLYMFLLLYVVYYIVNRSYLYYMSIFIILLFHN
jgi:hypothetical protein